MIRPYAYPVRHDPVIDVAVGRGPLMAGHAQDQVGFIAPARIWAKMDDIERSAASLNSDVDRNVREPGFIAGWRTWYSNWRRNYYDKYQSTIARLGALSGSDELNAAVERERETLRGWYESYTRQRLPDGSPVPFPSGLPPVRQGSDPNTNTGWSLPWWFWLATGAAALFIGYRFYVRFKQVKAQTAIAEEKLLPAFFERYGVPGKEATEVVRAGHRDQNPRRDLLTPLDLAYYARDASSRDALMEFTRGGGSSYGRDTRDERGDDRGRHADFDVPDYGYDEEDRYAEPNFTYDRSRDPLGRRYR